MRIVRGIESSVPTADKPYEYAIVLDRVVGMTTNLALPPSSFLSFFWQEFRVAVCGSFFVIDTGQRKNSKSVLGHAGWILVSMSDTIACKKTCQEPLPHVQVVDCNVNLALINLKP